MRRLTGKQKARIYRSRMCNPETGYMIATWTNSIQHVTANQTLNHQYTYWTLTKGFWPTQGVEDNKRIGDRIHAKKMYIRLLFETDDTPNEIYVRYILFQSNAVDPSITSGASISQFFRASVQNCAINGQVNHEAYRVLLDRTTKVSNSVTSGRSLGKMIEMNVYPKNWKKDIQFQNDGTSLKDFGQNVYLAAVAYQPNTVDGTGVGWLNVTARTYYSE